jgi:hypothetical protein
MDGITSSPQVRNAKSSGEIWLKRGRSQKHFRVKEVQDEEKPQLLKLYLDQFHTTVQRYFAIPAGSSLELFVGIASQYPTFELESVEAESVKPRYSRSNFY